mgnify:CR=1 FL=1
MVYDAARGEVVLFGGYDGEILCDMWRSRGWRWPKRRDGTPASHMEGRDGRVCEVIGG